MQQDFWVLSVMCRDCYKAEYEHSTGEVYTWTDLDGKRPTTDEYNRQEE